MKYEIISDGEMRALPTMEKPTETKHLPTIEQMKYINAYEKYLASLPTHKHRLPNRPGDIVTEEDFLWQPLWENEYINGNYVGKKLIYIAIPKEEQKPTLSDKPLEAWAQGFNTGYRCGERSVKETQSPVPVDAERFTIDMVKKAFDLSVCDLPEYEQEKYWNEFKKENNIE